MGRIFITLSFTRFINSCDLICPGPDGIRDHRVAVDEEHRYVGEGSMSPEGTSELDYLWRAPKFFPFPRPKSSSVGEIGWGIPQYTDWNNVLNGSQIRVSYIFI